MNPNRFCAVLVLFLLCGCVAGEPVMPEEIQAVRETASESPIYRFVPRYREEIAWYDVPRWITWAMFGNEKDGIFGEDANPPYSKSADFGTFVSWTVRNPMSNFCFYVIGSADWKTHHSYSLIRGDESGAHFFGPDRKPAVFGKGSTAFNFAFNDYKPFLSLKFPLSNHHQSDFYFGWRPDGSFGIKLRPYVKRDKVRTATAPTTQKL
jgi:hypothetical protein